MNRESHTRPRGHDYSCTWLTLQYSLRMLGRVTADQLGRAQVDLQVRDAASHTIRACGNDFNSFFSGHSAAAATAAGLVCVHHQHLPLFGGGVADLSACLVMIGAAGATGVLRVMADKHWATDVLLGWTIGALSGYVVPSLLHYGFGAGGALGEVRASGLYLVPTLLPLIGGAGLGALGTF